MEDRQRAEGRREVLERVYSIEYKYLLIFQYFQYSESNNSRSRVQHIHVIVEEVDSRRVVAHRATPSCVLAFGYQVIAKGLQYGCLRSPRFHLLLSISNSRIMGGLRPPSISSEL